MSERKHELAKRTDERNEETVVVLPASADRLDRDLVDRSVSDIREIIARTVSRGQDEVGRYLLREFFENDPEVYLASGPNRHASLRRLIDRCESIELPVSRTFLMNALRLAVIAQALPRAASFNRLPPSHRVELLRVKEPAKVEKLAARAVDGKLSVQKLRSLVRKAEDRDRNAPGRGRTAAPAVLKAIESCLRLLRDEETGKLLFRRGDVSAMTEEQQARAETAFRALDKRVADLRRILG